jgi:hypothetical protein
MHWRSALSLEEQALHDGIVTADQHSHNKSKKAHNCVDFLINGHDDCITCARTLCTYLYSKA